MSQGCMYTLVHKYGGGGNTSVVNPGLGMLMKQSVWTIENLQQRQTQCHINAFGSRMNHAVSYSQRF